MTRGARVILVRQDGQFCLVRHTYGEGWYLPGGGLGRTEDPDQAARREVQEELGIALQEVSLFGTYQARAEGKRDTVWVFTAQSDAEPVVSSPEISDIGWFNSETLPEATSPATRRRIQEWAGYEQRLDTW